jgi:nitrate reductase delta subunit
MSALQPVLDELSAVLSYPKEDYKARVERCATLIESFANAHPEEAADAAKELKKFSDAIAPLSVEELEELFTRTFDINPVCSLELGWHLYGETYERGAFMVQMRDVLRRCAVEESSELPDHLSHALLALGRMRDDEADAFVRTRLHKALGKMLEGFSSEGNPYQHVMRTAHDLSKQFALPVGDEQL